MTEEIIIDGVNVAMCEYFQQEDDEYTCGAEECNGAVVGCRACDNCYYKQLKRLEQELQKYKDMEAKGLEEFKDVGGCWGCGLQLQLNQDNIDIKRLEQENKLLKDNNNHLQAIIDDGRAENERFREENKELKKQIESDKGLITEGGKQQYDMTMAYDKCKTALEEIREIAVDIYTNDVYENSDIKAEKIIRKIDEVLGYSRRSSCNE